MTVLQTVRILVVSRYDLEVRALLAESFNSSIDISRNRINLHDEFVISNGSLGRPRLDVEQIDFVFLKTIDCVISVWY